MEWFLAEDCCESKMQKNSSTRGFVVDATPLRHATLFWRPHVGWVELLLKNASDSYAWHAADLGSEPLCERMAVGGTDNGHGHRYGSVPAALAVAAPPLPERSPPWAAAICLAALAAAAVVAASALVRQATRTLHHHVTVPAVAGHCTRAGCVYMELREDWLPLEASRGRREVCCGSLVA